MIKNLIALILVVLLMTFMFVGCKKPDDVYYVPSDITSSNKGETEGGDDASDITNSVIQSDDENLVTIPSSWQTGGDEDKSDSSSKKQNSATSSKKPASNTSSKPASSSDKEESNETPTNPNDMVVSKDDEGYNPWEAL